MSKNLQSKPSLRRKACRSMLPFLYSMFSSVFASGYFGTIALTYFSSTAYVSSLLESFYSTLGKIPSFSERLLLIKVGDSDLPLDRVCFACYSKPCETPTYAPP